MKIKAVTFDLDDTLWPLREVIIHAHKESNNWIIDKFPNMSKVFVHRTGAKDVAKAYCKRQFSKTSLV